MRLWNPSSRLHFTQLTSRAVGALVRRIAPLALLFAASLLPSIAFAQATAHAEYSLNHTEEVGEGNYIGYSDGDAGQDAPDSINMTGGLTAIFGDHDITIDASVVPTASSIPTLRTYAEHLYTLTGTDPQSNAWRVATSQKLARAELIDEFSISNTGGDPASIELFFLITGETDAEITIAQPGEVIYQFQTDIRLETETAAPNSGGGLDEQTITIGGITYTGIDENRRTEELVTMSFDLVDPSSFHLEMRFEIEADTELTNGYELPTLLATGVHRETFDDIAAEVIGLVVRDANGDILPNAVVVSTNGYDYPVLDEVPPPPLPSTVILSPIAASTDLGEYDGTVPVSQMLDQSGLYVPFESGVTGFDEYFWQTNADLANAAYYNNWQSEVEFNLPLQGHIVFDFGTIYYPDRLAIWNVSLENIRVLVRDSDLAPWTEVGQFTLPDRQSYSSVPVDILDLGGAHAAQSVRIEIDSAYPSRYGSWAYAIAGEVAVSTTPAPEPGSLAMLATGGLGLALLGGRRRRAATLRPGTRTRR